MYKLLAIGTAPFPNQARAFSHPIKAPGVPVDLFHSYTILTQEGFGCGNFVCDPSCYLSLQLAKRNRNAEIIQLKPLDG